MLEMKNTPMKKIFLNGKFILFLSIICISCDPSGETPENNEITGHPVLSREDVLEAWENIYLASEVDDPQWTGNTESCDAGTVPQTVHQKVLARINFYRLMCGLTGDIVFDQELNEKCQQAALMFQSNSNLSHDPPTNWKCWTSAGHEAAGSSNIGLGSINTPVHTTKAIDYYIDDSHTSSNTLGHRRWILFSKAKTFGHGSTNRANALWIADNTANPVPENLPNFISYPPPGFIPFPLCYKKWSFAVPEANFSNAIVVMLDQNGNEINANIEHRSVPGNPIVGDNSIIWNPDINLDGTTDNIFSITVKNVELFGKFYSYSYNVTVIPIE